MRLYAFGSNGSGQLGLGHQDDTSSPTLCQLQCSSVEATVVDVAAGGNHTLLLLSDGRCLGTGIPLHFGIGENKDSSNELGRTSAHFVDLSRSGGGRTTAVSATWTASFLLDDRGVLASGFGDSGELGLGHNVTASFPGTYIPNFPPEGTQVVQLSSCMAHSVAVLSNGEVYGWGKGRKGQLGEPAEDVWSPRRIEGLPFDVKRAACGKDFTCFIGAPSKGQLAVLGPSGRDRFDVRASAPKAVPQWKHLAASWGSIYVLLESGRIVAWGRNDHGQLPPPDLPNVRILAAGSEHCIALTESGEILTWGWGEHGNCGKPIDQNGDVRGVWNQIEADDHICRAFAGCATSFYATKQT